MYLLDVFFLSLKGTLREVTGATLPEASQRGVIVG